VTNTRATTLMIERPMISAHSYDALLVTGELNPKGYCLTLRKWKAAN
jgi:hypothetical protein